VKSSTENNREVPDVTAEPLESSSLVDLAVRRLRAEILSGALRPGERLVEEQLTRRFGTSRAPLREALRLLGQQGLVEHLPRRGVRVVELSGRDITELFGLRDVLEQYAVRRALADGAPADLSGLTAALQRMVDATAGGDAVAQAVAHREFHIALVALAGHHHLMRTYEPILLQLQLYMATNLRREAAQRPAQEAVERHRRLFDAVASGDVAAALTTLDTHGARTYLAPELTP
jgi:DNA-binding GntR family transcriptional regulator